MLNSFLGNRASHSEDENSSHEGKEELEDVIERRPIDWEDLDMEQYLKKFQSAQEKLNDDSGEEGTDNDSIVIMSLFYQV